MIYKKFNIIFGPSQWFIFFINISNVQNQSKNLSGKKVVSHDAFLKNVLSPFGRVWSVDQESFFLLFFLIKLFVHTARQWFFSASRFGRKKVCPKKDFIFWKKSFAQKRFYFRKLVGAGPFRSTPAFGLRSAPGPRADQLSRKKIF